MHRKITGIQSAVHVDIDKFGTRFGRDASLRFSEEIGVVCSSGVREDKVYLTSGIEDLVEYSG